MSRISRLQPSAVDCTVHPAILQIRKNGRPSKFSNDCLGCNIAPFPCTLPCYREGRVGMGNLEPRKGTPAGTFMPEESLETTDQIPIFDPFVPENLLLKSSSKSSLVSCGCCRTGNRPARRFRTFGNVPDMPDGRDIVADYTTSKLPLKVDLRNSQHRSPPDSSELVSCVAGAIAVAFHFDQRKREFERWADFVPSARFINYNLRFIEVDGPNFRVSNLRDGIKSVKLWGVCPQNQWPYDDTKLDERPTPQCYRVGKTFRATGYKSVQQTLPQLKGCLASGQPFIFGFIVHNSFTSAPVEYSGDMMMPEGESDPIEGGHTACAVGYDDTRQVFIVHNCWGVDWGDGGCFYIPYDYISDPKLAYDFWAISWVGTEASTKAQCNSECAPGSAKQYSGAQCVSM